MAQQQFGLKITQKTRDDGRIQLDVTVPASLVEQAQISAAMSRQTRMQHDLAEASRMGHEAGEELFRGKMDKEEYQNFLNNYTMHSLACFASSQQGLEIITNPEVSTTENVVSGKDFNFTVVVRLKPQLELSSYDPVTVKIPALEDVTDDEIDEQLAALAQSAATLEVIDKPVSPGCETHLSIETKSENFPIEGMTAERYFYRLGEGYLPAAFDENIIGMKAGETKTFDYLVPNVLPGTPIDENTPMLTVTSTVTIQNVVKRVVPEIDDAWVEENSPDAYTLEELREIIRRQGLEFKKKEAESRIAMAATTKLAARLVGTIAEELYVHTAHELLANLQVQLKREGRQLEDYLREEDLTEQEFYREIMSQARVKLRQGLALDALARHLGLTVTEEEIEQTLDTISKGNKEQARQQYEGSGRMYLLTEATLRDKARAWLIQTAKIEEAIRIGS